MELKSLDRMLALLAGLAALAVGGMVLGIVTTGVSQEFFEGGRTAERMVRRFQEAHLGTGLRLNLGFDNLFIIAYSTFFVFLAIRMRGLLDSWVLAVALGSLLMCGLLDSIENHHVRTMLHSAERGLPLSTEQTQLQMIATQVKFHFSYFGTFLFAFGFWRMGGLARAISIALWCYVPLGVLISVLPLEESAPFSLGRTCFFVVAFVLAAFLFWRKSQD